MQIHFLWYFALVQDFRFCVVRNNITRNDFLLLLNDHKTRLDKSLSVYGFKVNNSPYCLTLLHLYLTKLHWLNSLGLKIETKQWFIKVHGPRLSKKPTVIVSRQVIIVVVNLRISPCIQCFVSSFSANSPTLPHCFPQNDPFSDRKHELTFPAGHLACFPFYLIR